MLPLPDLATFEVMSTGDLLELLSRGRELLLKEPTVVRRPLRRTLVIADVHGDFRSTQTAVDRFLDEAYDQAVFLGDYVDRGPRQAETFALILALKLAHPGRVTLLRGNHETAEMNRLFQFHRVAHDRGRAKGAQLLAGFHAAFASLPVAATVGPFFCVHGGVPEGVGSIDEIAAIPRDQIEPTDQRLLQLMWNDPAKGPQAGAFIDNTYRGGFRVYSEEATRSFLDANGLTTILRGHEVILPDGYAWLHRDRLLCFHTQPNYADRGNRGWVVTLKPDASVGLIDIETGALAPRRGRPKSVDVAPGTTLSR